MVSGRRIPHAPIYDGPSIIWGSPIISEKDDSARVLDEDFQKFVTTHRAGSFRENLRGELIAARPFLDALSAQANEELSKSPRVDLARTYAINAHFTRVLATSKLTIVPFSVTKHPLLANYSISTGEAQQEMQFGGYDRDFNFFSSRNQDPDGKEYIITSNYAAVDGRVLKTLKEYGYKDLMEEYAQLFAPTLHDHLHGATATTFMHAKHDYAVADSELFKGNRNSAKKITPPSPLRLWTLKFSFSRDNLPGYEYWVNRSHHQVLHRLFSDKDRQVLISNAVSYIDRVGELKKKIEKEEGPEKANNMALFLVCNYVSALHMYLPPGHPDLMKLDGVVTALNLPAVKPRMFTIVRKVLSLPMWFPGEKILRPLAEIIKAEGYNADNNGEIKKLVKFLKNGGLIPAQKFYTSDEIAEALTNNPSHPFREWSKEIRKRFSQIDMHAFVEGYMNLNKNKKRPELDKFWETALLEAERYDFYPTNILGLFQALDELGIRRGEAVPTLTGMNAIRYTCLVQQKSYLDAFHRKENLIFDHRWGRKKETASDSEILQQYVIAQHEAIDKRQINKQTVREAMQDLEASRQFAATRNRVEAYAIKKSGIQPSK